VERIDYTAIQDVILDAGPIIHLEGIPLKSTLFIRRSLLREIIEEVKREFGLE